MAAQPDWLSDRVALGLRLAGVLGLGAPAKAKVRWIDAGRDRFRTARHRGWALEI